MDERKDTLQNKKGIKVEINKNESNIKRELFWSQDFITKNERDIDNIFFLQKQNDIHSFKSIEYIRYKHR